MVTRLTYPLALAILFTGSSDAFCITCQPRHSASVCTLTRLFLSSDDWSSFAALDDDEDDVPVDTNTYAKEEDSQEVKAEVGSSRPAPSIEFPAPPIRVPAGKCYYKLRGTRRRRCLIHFVFSSFDVGSQLELSEETVLGVLSACRDELGTLFGYSAENRGVGITGGVDYVDLDGPIVILNLKGRYWHQRTTVLDRVANYLQQRIPEIIEVTVTDPWQLTDEANEVW